MSAKNSIYELVTTEGSWVGVPSSTRSRVSFIADALGIRTVTIYSACVDYLVEENLAQVARKTAEGFGMDRKKLKHATGHLGSKVCVPIAVLHKASMAMTKEAKRYSYSLSTLMEYFLRNRPLLMAALNRYFESQSKKVFANEYYASVVNPLEPPEEYQPYNLKRKSEEAQQAAETKDKQAQEKVQTAILKVRKEKHAEKMRKIRNKQRASSSEDEQVTYASRKHHTVETRRKLFIWRYHNLSAEERSFDKYFEYVYPKTYKQGSWDTDNKELFDKAYSEWLAIVEQKQAPLPVVQQEHSHELTLNL